MIDLKARTLDSLRMWVWLAIGVVLYVAALVVVTAEYPGVQTILYKAGHVTTLAWIGYWISRNSLGRIKSDSTSTEKLSRAVLMAGVIIAGSMGL